MLKMKKQILSVKEAPTGFKGTIKISLFSREKKKHLVLDDTIKDTHAPKSHTFGFYLQCQARSPSKGFSDIYKLLVQLQEI